MSSFLCPFCYILFNPFTSLPFQLPCGHSVCQACVSSAPPTLTCPFDGRSVSVPSEGFPLAYFVNATGKNLESGVGERVDVLVQGCNEQLKALHATFDSLRSQVEARRFVLRAEASNLAAKDIQLRESLLESALRMKQIEEEETGALHANGQTKHLADKIATLQKEKFRLSCLFDKDNASRFISSIGTAQPEVQRNEPFECDSFTNVTYWMLPPCCYRHYCCVKCHNAKEDHVWQYANRMICVFCGREQEYKKLPNKCMYCLKEHTGVVSK